MQRASPKKSSAQKKALPLEEDFDTSGTSAPPFALTLRKLRQAAQLTMSQLAQRSNLAVSTLSKIEKGLMSPTYDTMLALSRGLRVEMAELFSEKPHTPVSGRRIITRKDEGAKLATKNYEYEMLCGELANKQFIPMVAEIKANSIFGFGELIKHPGEEFIFVIAGEVTLHTEHYQPTLLTVGDCCYFDSTMGHAIVSTSESPAKIIWICSQIVAPLKP